MEEEKERHKGKKEKQGPQDKEKQSQGLQGRRWWVSPGASQHEQSEITVSPQHPCEVGWNVAAIIMPTSQTRPGHRHGRESRGRAQGADPLCRLPASLLEPGPPHTGVACKQSLGHRREKIVGLKTKRTKAKKVMQRGKISIFFPSGQILS